MPDRRPREVRATLGDDPIGWERLGVIVDVRAAFRARLIVVTGDNMILIHRDVPADLRERMARHRDVVEHVINLHFGTDPEQLWENQ